MKVAEVNSYSVSLTRAISYRDPQDIDGGPPRPWERKLSLKLGASRWGDGVTLAVLSFMNDQDEISRNNHYAVRYQSTVYFYLPVSSFADFYKVVQSERPLMLFWNENDATGAQRYISSWKLSTSTDEPIGEGDSES